MACEHLKSVTTEQFHRKPNTPNGCKECLKIGDRWVHLRLCFACGHVGCCDSSKNKHATRHFHTTNHPTMRSIEPGETWMWCYVHETTVESPFA